MVLLYIQLDYMVVSGHFFLLVCGSIEKGIIIEADPLPGVANIQVQGINDLTLLVLEYDVE